MKRNAILSMFTALGAAACGSAPEIAFPKEVAVAPPVAQGIQTATFSLG